MKRHSDIEDMARCANEGRFTSRICGICPLSHLLASAKAGVRDTGTRRYNAGIESCWSIDLTQGESFVFLGLKFRRILSPAGTLDAALRCQKSKSGGHCCVSSRHEGANAGNSQGIPCGFTRGARPYPFSDATITMLETGCDRKPVKTKWLMRMRYSLGREVRFELLVATFARLYQLAIHLDERLQILSPCCLAGGESQIVQLLRVFLPVGDWLHLPLIRFPGSAGRDQGSRRGQLYGVMLDFSPLAVTLRSAVFLFDIPQYVAGVVNESTITALMLTTGVTAGADAVFACG